ncbi:hypothetical protein KO317_00520 [Candidatus Micrarchaeota archaeon]|nr:hypothetical protein [Candidatus Micrarchaeota archaeon]
MNHKIFFTLFVLLFSNLSASCGFVCDIVVDEFLLPTFVAVFLTLGFISIIYMIGKITENPRLNVWAQAELGQAILTVIIAVFILGGITWFCTEGSGVAISAGMYSGGSPYSGNMYDISCSYLSNIAEYSNDVMSLIRYNIAVGNIRASLNEFGCKGDELHVNPYGCAMAFLGGPATSWNAHASNYNYVSLFNTSLNIATICFFNSLFLLYLLQYISSGFLYILLPAGIIIRAIPFLRGLGGALIAIIVGLFLFLPFMLTIEAMIWGPIMQNWHSSMIFPDERDIQNDIWPVSLEGIVDIMDWNTVDDFSHNNLIDIFKSTTHIFLAGVFLPYLGFIGVVLVTKDFSKLLGEEVDISKLTQLI